jgi:hypothetical protein
MMAAMKSMRNLLFLAISIALIGAACGSEDPEAAARGSSPPPDAAAPSTEPGDNDSGDQNGGDAEPEDLAPDFSVETFDGDTFKLSEHRGMPVVLNFWESW